MLSAERNLLFAIGDMPQLKSLYLRSDGTMLFTCQAAKLGLTLEKMQLQYCSCSGASLPELLHMFGGRGMQFKSVQCRQPGELKLVTKVAAGCSLDFKLAKYCYCKACQSCLAARGILVDGML